jgi:hypothetical protein
MGLQSIMAGITNNLELPADHLFFPPPFHLPFSHSHYKDLLLITLRALRIEGELEVRRGAKIPQILGMVGGMRKKEGEQKGKTSQKPNQDSH